MELIAQSIALCNYNFGARDDRVEHHET